MSYNVGMKSLTVRLPNEVVERLEAEARRRKMSKSDIVRERLVMAEPHDTSKLSPLIADLAGSVDGLAPDMSRNIKAYLKSTGYGRKRPR
jgi:hypothetical protein